MKKDNIISNEELIKIVNETTTQYARALKALAAGPGEKTEFDEDTTKEDQER